MNEPKGFKKTVKFKSVFFTDLERDILLSYLRLERVCQLKRSKSNVYTQEFRELSHERYMIIDSLMRKIKRMTL